MTESQTIATPFPNWKFVVFRTAPRQRVLPAHELEVERANARRRQAGPDFDVISNHLCAMLNGHFTKPKLMSLAHRIAAIKGIPLDRDAKRLKDSLICWFCEHCKDEIMHNTAPVPARPPTVQDPGRVSQRTADLIPEELWAAWEKDFPLFE
jgi:hypothetical protein